jgi:alpha 1,2-mannosyltransferase
MQDDVIRSAGVFPIEQFSGGGIVIVAGGIRYFTCAWVCITLLRRVLGCTLPIQIWYRGPEEMSQDMITLLQPFGVECVDLHEVQRRYPARRLGSYECKPYEILHSPFKEVIHYTSCDNVGAAGWRRLRSRTGDLLQKQR